MKMESVIEKDFEIIHPDAKLSDLIKVITHSKRNLFPVVEENGMFMGVVLLDNISDIMFNPDQYDKVDIMTVINKPPAFIEPKDTMESVMLKFEQTEAWNLPVLDNGKYIGYISKSKIFSAYRQWL